MTKIVAAGLVLLLAAGGTALARGGGRVKWNRDSDKLLEEARTTGRPVLVYFASDACGGCKQLDEKVFSDEAVVKAGERWLCLLVDFEREKKLVARYMVKSTPTVYILDPDGRQVNTLSARDSAGAVRQLDEFREAYMRYPRFTDNLGKALRDAKKDVKPLGIYFTGDTPAAYAVNLAFLDESLKETLPRFVFARIEARKGSDECAKYGITVAPTIVLLSPSEERIGTITGKKTAKELKKELEDLLHPKPADPAPAAASGAPPAEPKWVITLKNGGKVKATAYEEEDDKYILKIGNGSTSIKKEDVKTIKRIEASTDD